MSSTVWKVRDLRARLRELGCTLARTRGSHETWKLPTGESLPPIIASHGNDEIYCNGLVRVLNARGIQL